MLFHYLPTHRYIIQRIVTQENLKKKAAKLKEKHRDGYHNPQVKSHAGYIG